MYKISDLASEYKKKLITADQAAAMVENGSRIHFGLGCGTVVDIDEALAWIGQEPVREEEMAEQRSSCGINGCK